MTRSTNLAVGRPIAVQMCCKLTLGLMKSKITPDKNKLDRQTLLRLIGFSYDM